MRLTVLEEGCEGKLDETFATLLFNAQNPPEADIADRQIRPEPRLEAFGEDIRLQGQDKVPELPVREEGDELPHIRKI